MSGMRFLGALIGRPSALVMLQDPNEMGAVDSLLPVFDTLSHDIIFPVNNHIPKTEDPIIRNGSLFIRVELLVSWLIQRIE